MFPLSLYFHYTSIRFFVNIFNFKQSITTATWSKFTWLKNLWICKPFRLFSICFIYFIFIIVYSNEIIPIFHSIILQSNRCIYAICYHYMLMIIIKKWNTSSFTKGTLIEKTYNLRSQKRMEFTIWEENCKIHIRLKKFTTIPVSESPPDLSQYLSQYWSDITFMDNHAKKVPLGVTPCSPSLPFWKAKTTWLWCNVMYVFHVSSLFDWDAYSLLCTVICTIF